MENCAASTRENRGAHREEYLRNYRREWIRARRCVYFAGKSCETCDSTEKLELHHRDPQQKITHAIWSWSAERRTAEISKCTVLCKSCHRGITRLDFSSRPRKSSRLSSVPTNIYWIPGKRKWNVAFKVMGTKVRVGQFRNIVTARLAAESFRRSLSLYFAELNVTAQIACVKQTQLFPVSEVQSCQ